MIAMTEPAGVHKYLKLIGETATRSAICSPTKSGRGPSPVMKSTIFSLESQSCRRACWGSLSKMLGGLIQTSSICRRWIPTGSCARSPAGMPAYRCCPLSAGLIRQLRLKSEWKVRRRELGSDRDQCRIEHLTCPREARTGHASR
jgi:hypothetical protein